MRHTIHQGDIIQFSAEGFVYAKAIALQYTGKVFQELFGSPMITTLLVKEEGQFMYGVKHGPQIAQVRFAFAILQHF